MKIFWAKRDCVVSYVIFTMALGGDLSSPDPSPPWRRGWLDELFSSAEARRGSHALYFVGRGGLPYCKT